MAVASAIVGSLALLGCAAERIPMELRAIPAAAEGGYAFSPMELVAPAGTPLRVVFDNPTDAPHTLIFLSPIDRDGGALVRPGQGTQVEFVAPRQPGSYRFVCNVHEGMDGVLVIE